MNERIKELIKQATSYAWNSCDVTEELDEQKFAELIVQECVQVCIDKGKAYEIKSAGEYQSATFADAINKHFGVKQ